jgi:homoserine/homoserine lactone efflux protein
MSLDTWLGFFVASWLISFTPGPGAVSTMASAVRVGVRRSGYNLLGLELGVFAVLLVVASGLGAVIIASATLFTILKWIGVAYLLFLGVLQFRAKGDAGHQAAAEIATHLARRSLVLQGFLVNATNPKGIVFMLAVLPQFIDPDAAQVPQYAICAATLVFTDLVAMNIYAVFASRMLRLLRTPTRSASINRVFGSLYVGAAGLLAAFGRHA